MPTKYEEQQEALEKGKEAAKKAAKLHEGEVVIKRVYSIFGKLKYVIYGKPEAENK